MQSQEVSLPLGQLVPPKDAGLPLSERTLERAYTIGIPINGQRVKLRVVRCGRKVFTTSAWAADFVVACTRLGEPAEPEPTPLLTSEERARKRHTADVLARHGIAMPDPAGGA